MCIDKKFSLLKKDVAVIIPCYLVENSIEKVVHKSLPYAGHIFIVDDCCPKKSYLMVNSRFKNHKKITIIHNHENLGVGGAVKSGYKRAIHDGYKYLVKIDGDGQMDPSLIPLFVYPLYYKEADYVKGNRFYDSNLLSKMPLMRLFGNTALSFINKFSSGYWNVFDPTNGFTAISSTVLNFLPLHKISNRYFFESDMLFRLNTIRAVVEDIPISAIYNENPSSLKIKTIFFDFLYKCIRNTFKRIIYNYYLRDFNIASIQLPIGIIMISYAVIKSFLIYIESGHQIQSTPNGTIMIILLNIIIGLQFIFDFIRTDISSIPVKSINKKISQ